MNINLSEIRSFFHSQYFSDGLRITAGILLPSLVLNELDRFNWGLAMSLGALCICAIDVPGPASQKRNSMALGNLFLFLVAAITGFARLNVFTLGLEIVLFSFLFSMFTVYGDRATTIGTSSLLIMIFMMDKILPASAVLPYSAGVLLGGLWYMVFSLIFFAIRPYRAVQQALGEHISDIARFLRIKADFYAENKNIDDTYRRLISHQIKVSRLQNALREMLFKGRLAVQHSTSAKQALVLTYDSMVDIFEQIMATHDDYEYIREKFRDTGILNEINELIHHLATALDGITYLVLFNDRSRRSSDFSMELEVLKLRIVKSSKNHRETDSLILKKILMNLSALNEGIRDIHQYYNTGTSSLRPKLHSDLDYGRFVTHQNYSLYLFFDNCSFASNTFKHALRVSLVCLVGFIIARTLAQGHHSYWIILTIIVILKPDFSLSKQRNYQRLIGTIGGGTIGILVLGLIPNTTLQFIFLTAFMIGAYSFLRINYVVCVIFTTPFVLILFKFLGVGLFNIAQERILDTLIGSSIALIASYILFPTWEIEQIQRNLGDVITANISYLATIAENLSGKAPGITAYKLARKDVFVKSASLSAAFERMMAEPKSKRRKIIDIHRFIVLNHTLSSYIATVSSGLSRNKHLYRNAESLKLVIESISILHENNQKLQGSNPAFYFKKPLHAVSDTAYSSEDKLFREQLEFINQISRDITGITDNILRH